MNKETRLLIEQAFKNLHEAQGGGNELTEAGRLMYGLCLAVLDLDNKLNGEELYEVPSINYELKLPKLTPNGNDNEFKFD